MPRVAKPVEPAPSEQLSPFRQILATAPLDVVAAVILMQRRMTQRPPPSPEPKVGADQWTIMYDDENHGIKVMCEKNGVNRARIEQDRMKAEADRSVAVRNLKGANVAFEAETDLRNKAMFREKCDGLEAQIKGFEEIIARDAESEVWSKTLLIRECE